MTYTSVELLTEFECRYKFKAGIYNVQLKTYEDVMIFLDTGCYNTMIPKHIAEQAGHPLGFCREYRIGGHTIKAEAFSISKIMIGDFILERVLAFAGNYPGEYENEIILGTNVINNWEMVINKESHIFKFRENPPKNIANKKHIYQNYFDPAGNYQCVQDAEQITAMNL